jgi:hypothetical protein
MNTLRKPSIEGPMQGYNRLNLRGPVEGIIKRYERQLGSNGDYIAVFDRVQGNQVRERGVRIRVTAAFKAQAGTERLGEFTIMPFKDPAAAWDCGSPALTGTSSAFKPSHRSWDQSPETPAQIPAQTPVETRELALAGT